MQRNINSFTVAALLILVLLIGVSISYAAAGGLDTTFGTGGKVQTAFSFNSIPTRALLQPDGKIVVVGSFGVISTLATEAFGLVRYLPSGKLDTTFGKKGSTFAAITNFINMANSAALQSDGKILVAGAISTADGTTSEFGLMRFNTNGTLDSTFGTGGKVTTNFVGVQLGGVYNPATAVVIQPDGRILVGGSASECAKCGTDTALARYNANGSLDSTFGTAGTVRVHTILNAPSALAILSNGDFVGVNGSNILQFSPQGTLRASVTSGTVSAASSGATDLFLSNGSYYFAGSGPGQFRHESDLHVFRFTPTGTADSTFNNAPFMFSPAAHASSSDYAQGAAIQADGKLLVAGGSQATNEAGLVRVNTNGSLDTAFGTGGVVNTAFPSTGFSQNTSVLIQADGKIVSVGQGLNNSTGIATIVLARFLGQ
jgi:uncharacterized delta-60 repeat protein